MNQDSRGMVKWLPYQSLTPQASILAEMRYEKNKRPRPHIASDRAEEINEILVHYASEEVKAQYWEDGYLKDLLGVIKKIDATFRYLILNGKRIDFVNLIDLQRV